LYTATNQEAKLEEIAVAAKERFSPESKAWWTSKEMIGALINHLLSVVCIDHHCHFQQHLKQNSTEKTIVRNSNRQRKGGNCAPPPGELHVLPVLIHSG
jgi:hypothetical protein